MLATFLPSSRSVWKLVSTPATEVRLIKSIGPLAVAPGIPLQERVLPVKIDTSWLAVRVFVLFVITQIAYLAIGQKPKPAGSVGSGSRETSAIVTRPAATSLMPTWAPPCAI